MLSPPSGARLSRLTAPVLSGIMDLPTAGNARQANQANRANQAKGGLGVDETLLRGLAEITDEERRLLQGDAVDRALYASGRAFEADAAKLLERGKLITSRAHTRFAPFPRHSHNYIEILYMCRGRTRHRVNGGEPVVLEAGELLFLNQHASHAVERAEAEDIAVNFIVLPQFFDRAFDLIGADNLLARFLLGALRRDGEEVSYLHFRVRDVLPAQNLVENLVWTLANDPPNAQRINQVTMGLLLLELMNHTEHIVTRDAARVQSPLVVAALREIEENYRRASLSEVAARYRVTLAYVSMLVRRATGSTFQSLLQQKRLEKAAWLLRETQLPADEIIRMVGYETTSYFYQLFRRRLGMTPKEYRNQNRSRS